MRTIITLALRNLSREAGRSLIRIAVLAAAVALLGSMLVFVSHSLRVMTAGAARSVPLDWQGPVDSYMAAQSVATGVQRQSGVLAAVPSATATYAGAEHISAQSGDIRTGHGAILAVPLNYPSGIQTFRFLRGSFEPGRVVLDQQLAASLQAQVGDRIVLRPTANSAPRPFVVSGIVLVTAPDVLFAPLNPQIGPAPAQPPAEIVVMPIDTFARQIAPSLPTLTAATIGSSAVPGAQAGTQWQVQAQVDPTVLHGDPSAALQQAGQVRNRVERNLPGQVVFVDNLSEALTLAAGDALYAQTLYIMLAVPGALVALGLAYLAALGTAERDRRDLALLRARGATRRGIITLAGVESLALGVIAGLVGFGGALLAVHRLVGGSVGLTGGRLVVTVLACVAVAVSGAAAARLAAGLSALRGTIAEGRRSARRATKPLWQRLYLDWLALVISGLIYWLTSRTGFSAVVNPDSNPTLSLSVYMFFAPAFLWLGATLLLVRLRGGGLAWLARRAAGTETGQLRGFLLASASRRGGAINRGLILVGLLLAFGVQLGVFSATYTQQAHVDAQLTIGADLAVQTPARTGTAVHETVARTSGVAATTAIDHAYAYVGPDLQDTYGIDPLGFSKATTLRDSYFLQGTAAQTINRLAATPDGILVSKETITDYSLRLGDLVRLRVLDHATGQFAITGFHVVGVVTEFPSAPKDSFMVANIRYLDRVTHSPGPNVVFAKTSDNPTIVGRRVADATRQYGTSVRTITDQNRQTTSTITTVDFSGISTIEEAFSIILAAAAIALFIQLALAERRREFATMAALGTPLRDISAFLWSEAALVLGAGLLLALGLGLLLAVMLIAMLQHVFDPPPDHLALPWGFFLRLGGAALLAGLLATVIATRRLRQLPLGAILRE